MQNKCLLHPRQPRKLHYGASQNKHFFFFTLPPLIPDAHDQPGLSASFHPELTPPPHTKSLLSSKLETTCG